MLYIRYIVSELRRRKARTILTSLGLAVGVGLVVTVTALSAGLDDAQTEVLEPLTGVGTDMSVSRPIVASQPGSDEEQEFSAGPGANLSTAEQEQLRRENGILNLDFSEFGDPGDEFTTNQFLSTELSFPETEAADIAELDGVDQVGGALTLDQLTISGTVPAEGVQPGLPGVVSPMSGGGGSPGTGFEQFSVTGVDARRPGVARLTPDQVIEGRYLKESNGREAVVSESYASSNGVGLQSRVEVGDERFRVVGIATSPLGGEASDIYVPLDRLQEMSDRENRVNVLQVRADLSGDVARVNAGIEAIFPGSQVTTAQDLADRVSGSLVDAGNLSSKLGTALAIVALVAAFGIASLLTLSSVNKRTRELGTLKALGWPRWLVVRQVSGESLAQGALGGLLGALTGILGAATIGALGLSLEASVASSGPGPGGPFGHGAVEPGSSTVNLEAPVDLDLLLIAVGLALLGGLIAGTVGGLRAARLRPAEALRSVE